MIPFIPPPITAAVGIPARVSDGKSKGEFIMRNVISISVVAVMAVLGPAACSDDLTPIISPPYEEAHGVRVQISDDAFRSNQTLHILVENRGALPVFLEVCPFRFERLEETADGNAWVVVPGNSQDGKDLICEPRSKGIEPSGLTRFDLPIDNRPYGVYRIVLPQMTRNGEVLLFNEKDLLFRSPTFGVVEGRARTVR